MKIKAATIPICFISIHLISSIYQVLNISALASVIRIFRFATIPFLLIFILDMLPKLKRKQANILILLSLPVIVILFVTLIQLFALPSDVLSTHITGSVRIISLSLVFLYLFMILNYSTAKEYIKIFLPLLCIIFILAIFQYPNLILNRNLSISSVLSNYGTSEKNKSFGLFGSANEDANALMTLFPIVLWWLENKFNNIKKIILKFIMFIFFPLILLYNGTRTALLITLPFVVFLFYSNLSIKKIFILLLSLSPLIGTLFLFAPFLFESTFAEDAQGGGTFGWRMENVWIPAITYTLKNSPIFGFGSRGWEYVSQNAGITSLEGEIIPPHNGYISVYVTWGVIGFIAYVAFLLILLKESFQLARSQKAEVAKTSQALFCSVFAYCIWASISNANEEQGWSILFVLATLIASVKTIEFSDQDKQLSTLDT